MDFLFHGIGFLLERTTRTGSTLDGGLDDGVCQGGVLLPPHTSSDESLMSSANGSR
jgi:hypothetical protein